MVLSTTLLLYIYIDQKEEREDLFLVYSSLSLLVCHFGHTSPFNMPNIRLDGKIAV
jgi:hypothetical protein